jgi:hypothetical protein
MLCIFCKDENGYNSPLSLLCAGKPFIFGYNGNLRVLCLRSAINLKSIFFISKINMTNFFQQTSAQQPSKLTAVRSFTIFHATTPPDFYHKSDAREIRTKDLIVKDKSQNSAWFLPTLPVLT